MKNDYSFAGEHRATDNRSIYPGVRVHKNKTCITYSVRITCNRVEYFVGTFPTLTQAVNARNRAENFFHKEFSEHKSRRY